MSDFSMPTSTVKDIRDIVLDTKNYASSVGMKDFQKFAVKYNFAFNDYIEAKLKSLSKVKLAFFSSQVVDIEDVYVKQKLKFNNHTYSEDDFFDLLIDKKRFIVSATAGAGKSCLLKSLFLNIIREKKDYLPLFLELRKVNDKYSSIKEALIADIGLFNQQFCQENLEFIFKRQNTILFLDGFDEINYDNKEDYIKELNQFSELYPELIVLVSSRPEYGVFQQWSLYNVADVKALDLAQACQLIEKLEYEEEVKKRFLIALQLDLFSKHKNFTSNPLLLTIMLLTYEQFGDIPEKMHIFYEEAFRTLFQRHDSYKQGYKRKRLTDLDIEEFKNVFAFFCLVTYCKQLFNFDEKELLELLGKCLKEIDKQHIDVASLKTELLNNVPLLMQDGLSYCFTHRSFQEYFTAYYLTQNAEVNNKIFDIIGKRLQHDNVLNMSFNMKQRVVEDKWILPKIEAILDEVSRLDSDNEVDLMINKYDIFFGEVELFPEYNDNEMEYTPQVGYPHKWNSSFVSFIVSLYDIENFKYEIFIKNRINVSQVKSKEFDALVFLKEELNPKELTSYEKELFVYHTNIRTLVNTEIYILEYIKELIIEKRENTVANIDSILFSDD